jgi:hypothetical protein
MILPALFTLLMCGAGDLQMIAGAGSEPLRVEAALSGAALEALPEGPVERAQGERWLQVALVDETSGKPGGPILGVYLRKQQTLTWRPRFALSPGCLYRATLRAADGSEQTADYRTPQPVVGPAPIVTEIYPPGDRLPANLLKFYITFSQPMREGSEIFDQLLLLDESGAELPEPWRRTELWSDDARRLTLYIHPGRIKQGVNLREQMGPVLTPGKNYTLVVSAQVRAADGQRLKSEQRKRFAAIAEDRISPAPQNWRLAAPAPASRDPLVVDTDEALDHFLLARCLSIYDADGSLVKGAVKVGAGDSQWRFVPAQDWSDAQYTLQIAPILEDLAGNTPVRRFDDYLRDQPDAPAVLRREFRPRSGQ